MSYTYDTQKHKIVGMDIKLFVNMMINIKKESRFTEEKCIKICGGNSWTTKHLHKKLWKTQNIGILMSEEDKILYGKTIFALHTWKKSKIEKIKSEIIVMLQDCLEVQHMLIVTWITKLPIKYLWFFITCMAMILILLCKELVSLEMLK